MTNLSIKKIFDDYVSFAIQILNDKSFSNTVYSLLPFDKSAAASMKIEENNSIISALGLTVSRFDFNPDMFALGILIKMKEDNSTDMKAIEIYLCIRRSYSQLIEYAGSEKFRKEVEKYCWEQTCILFQENQ